MEVLPLKYSINSMSSSPDKSSVICGGREILKIINVNHLEEKRSLRVGKPNLNYSTQDLAWHLTEQDWILSAAKNSFVVLWNLNRVGANKLEQVFKGHTKVVNRVKWHWTEPDLFLSAGQDGILRLWDRRVPGSALFSMRGNSEGARDVAFSPFMNDIFAASYDSGCVQLWDRRKANNCFARITAHKRNALSIDWHPEKHNVLASGGSDKNIKVWDTETYEMINKVQAPEPVSRIKWVPQSPNQIASASHTHDNNLYTWHLEESWLPHYVFKGHAHPITDFILVGESIVTCGGDGNVIKHSPQNAYRPYKFVPNQAIAVSPLNQIAVHFDSLSSRNPQEFISAINSGAKHHASTQIHSLGQNKSQIQNLAKNYQFKSKDTQQLCQINSQVSQNKKELWQALSKLASIREPGNLWLSSIIQESLKETVEYYSELGDVQTAACISSAFKTEGPIQEYSELLRQLQIHKEATKLEIPQSNVEIFCKCPCGKDCEETFCEKCKNISSCAVCNKQVRGLYSWCQGCSHGGHLLHLKKWFQDNIKCPSGCGHECSMCTEHIGKS